MQKCAGEWFDYTMAAHMVKDRKSVHSVQRVGNLNLDVLVMTTHGLTVIDDYLRHLARDWWAGQAESRTVATCDACSVGPVARNEGYLLGSHLWCEECYTSKNVKGQLKRNPDAAGNGMLLKAVHWAAKYYAENHVKRSDDALVRKEATERVTDQSVLADIAKNDEHDRVRKEATERVTNQSVLADIAKNDKARDVRQTAVERVTDRDVLADIAKNDKARDVRQTAVERVTDRDVLADIAKNDKARDVRQTAVERVTDRDVLADIAKNDKDRDVRQAAESRIKMGTCEAPLVQ